jgi:dCMP deaminase
MLKIAFALSERGTCAKKQVGCVIVDKYGNILSSGYNGQPRGAEHCAPVTPCPAYLDANLSCQAIHAEVNALMRCPDPEKARVIYITEAPCQKCSMLIANTAIKHVITP